MSKSRKKAVVADSWDDEDVSDDAPEGLNTPQPSAPSTASPPQSATLPLSSGLSTHDQNSDGYSAPSSPQDPSAAKRPEKTDAVARRMIAAGLGLRAPKQTEEQKAYQRAIREQERKRRELEKEEEQRKRELTEKAKAAIWDD